MPMDILHETYCNIHPYFNNILVHNETVNKHCKKLKAVLVTKQNGLKFNKDKIQIVVSQ